MSEQTDYRTRAEDLAAKSQIGVCLVEFYDMLLRERDAHAAEVSRLQAELAQAQAQVSALRDGIQSTYEAVFAYAGAWAALPDDPTDEQREMVSKAGDNLRQTAARAHKLISADTRATAEAHDARVRREALEAALDCFDAHLIDYTEGEIREVAAAIRALLPSEPKEKP